jgi:hypothetical protein
MNYADREKFEALKERFFASFRLSRLYSDYLCYSPEFITSKDISALTENGEFSEKEAVTAMLTELFSLDYENPSDRVLIKNYITPSVRILDTEKYKSDPYYRRVKIDFAKSGDFELNTEIYPAYRAFVAGDVICEKDFTEYAPLGFFKEDFPFLAVSERGNEWMTLTPVDMDTVVNEISRAHGRVVTFGLGLGYFAYMAARKPDVESVTVVERSESVIELFKTYILPALDFKEKIKIVCADAYEYAEKMMPKENFDYAFVDIWRDAGDGAPAYLRFKALEHLSKNTEFDYWIEGFILSRLRALRFEKILENTDRYESFSEILELFGKESLQNGDPAAL